MKPKVLVGRDLSLDIEFEDGTSIHVPLSVDEALTLNMLLAYTAREKMHAEKRGPCQFVRKDHTHD